MFRRKARARSPKQDWDAPMPALCISLRATRGFRSPNCSACLKVTKQSLNRVLNDLLKGGFIERKAGMQDRRTRRLQLTAHGAALADAIWQAQRPLLAARLQSGGPGRGERLSQSAAGLRRRGPQKP